MSPDRIGRNRKWQWLEKGGDYANYYAGIHLVINREHDGAELAAVNERVNGQTAQSRQASSYYFQAGAFYTDRSQRGFSARALPAGCVIAGNAPAVLSLSDVSSDYLLGWLNARLIRALIEMKAIDGKFYPGFLKELPWRAPDNATRRDVEAAARDLVLLHLKYERRDEVDPHFTGVLQEKTLLGAGGDEHPEGAWSIDRESARSLQGRISHAIDQLYGCDSRDLGGEVLERDVTQEFTCEAWSEDEYRRRRWAYYFGVAIGRFLVLPPGIVSSVDPYAVLSSRGPAVANAAEARAFLVDDPGHPADVLSVMSSLGRTEAGFEEVEVLRSRLRREFFGIHLEQYSKSRRKAPIYWQLSTASASYSVWLYYHRLTPDSLFDALHGVIAQKLALEERRLLSLTQEVGPSPTASQGREIAAQEAFVDELRAFRDEVARVAPLWKPDLDDGVLLTMAPLWRLVPQHRAWQKELKTAWDSLCEGEYDWAHVAMHLWPERVVPKCAKDRSLAIAHDLEEVFWEEDARGKWVARPKPLRPIEELVRERTSPAVKAALKDLLEAPVAGGAAKGAGRGRKRKA